MADGLWKVAVRTLEFAKSLTEAGTLKVSGSVSVYSAKRHTCTCSSMNIDLDERSR